MALSAPSLEDVVKPHMKDEFEFGIRRMCHDDFNDVGERWFPRTCCDEHAKFDKRVPGKRGGSSAISSIRIELMPDGFTTSDKITESISVPTHLRLEL